jgi:C-terminal binding protein
MAHPTFNVLVLDSATNPLSEELDVEAEVLEDVAQLKFVRMDDQNAISPGIEHADALIVSSFPRVSRQMIARLDHVRVIHRNGVGYDNIDVDAARDSGIPVCNVPDYGTEEVADHAILLTLAIQRNLMPSYADVRKGNWSWRAARPGRRLRGQNFGIVGCGRIGSATALRAKAFGFSVCIYDPYLPSGWEKALGVHRAATLEELLGQADVLSLHAPLTNETSGMIGSAQLALMKPDAILINTARGPLVQEAALLEALQSKKIRGAALDVVEREPQHSARLHDLPNCLITPHIAFYSEQALHDMRASAAQNVRRVLEGKAPQNVVNGLTGPMAVVG